MKTLAESAKKIRLILGDGVKRIQPTEYETINFQRKALYARCNIRKGQAISHDMISIKGPSGDILPKYIDIVIGRIARDDIKEDYPIEWKDI
jgi:sialic acid synthase SpsE